MNNKGFGMVEILLIIVILFGLMIIFKEPIVELITAILNK